MNKLSLLVLFVFSFNPARSQLTVSGASFSIQSGATVTVMGDLSSNKNISGLGNILLKGDTVQHLNMNGFSIPNLEIDNADSILLTSDARISNSLLFTNGVIHLGDYNLALADIASLSGMGAGKFAETDGTGQVFKEISANVSSSEIPVGAGNIYRPLFLTTSGTYSAAKIGVHLQDTLSGFAPPMISDYLKANWNITQTGINGTLDVSAQYSDPTDIVGNEENLRGYLYDGNDWSSENETHNTVSNQISFSVTASSGTLTAMDRFDLLNAKVFLQGAYNSGTHQMSDNLRAPSNLIPLSDPYRTGPYNTSFIHVNNSLTETVAPSVFADQPDANDNIVDWVFLELRDTATSGNAVLQTRSALVQRDGDIVDVDGKSPVTFNNVDSGYYTIAVRHRNHLGLSTDPATFTPMLNEKKSAAVLVDFTTSVNIFGPATAYAVATDGKHILWGGNANMDKTVKFAGFQNDKDYLLLNTLGGNTGTILSNVYSPSDINLNREVKYNGFNNDKDFLYNSILESSTSAQRIQSMPN
jgi:hypothetical protein